MRILFYALLGISAYTPVRTLAASVEIIGACSAAALHQGEVEARGQSVGRVTVAFLEARNLPYLGAEEGLNSILGTPVGDAAIEVVGDDEMRAYGWCYEVDGRQPDVMPHEVKLQGSERVRWFYAFSHYKGGEWITYCTPAHTVRPKNLCKLAPLIVDIKQG